MYPSSLALLEDDATYAEYLSLHLTGLDVRVQRFGSASALLESSNGLEFDFYVVDLTLPGMDGVEFIKQLRRQSSAGVLVVSGRTEQQVFADVVRAGADMFLAKPVTYEQVALAIEAVHRRSRQSLRNAQAWRLDQSSQELVAPDGARVGLSEGDMVVLREMAKAEHNVVTRETLRLALGYPETDQATSALNAAIFRLRRRIERVTPLPVPLHSRSRMGYEFRAAFEVI